MITGAPQNDLQNESVLAPNVSPHYAAPLAAYYNDSFIAGRGKRG